MTSKEMGRIRNYESRNEPKNCPCVSWQLFKRRIFHWWLSITTSVAHMIHKYTHIPYIDATCKANWMRFATALYSIGMASGGFCILQLANKRTNGIPFFYPISEIKVITFISCGGILSHFRSIETNKFSRRMNIPIPHTFPFSQPENVA